MLLTPKKGCSMPNISDQGVINHINETIEQTGGHARTSCPPHSRAMCKYYRLIDQMIDAGKLPDANWLVKPIPMDDAG